ncbi:MAG: hypothetical protein HY225_02195 [Candidatus Vogelbacteria bacterium]|nr:hypothetical protein [Candidatus Vogelbacteria bacterium]
MTKKQLLMEAVAGTSIIATTILPFVAFASSNVTESLTFTGGSLSLSAPSTVTLDGLNVSTGTQTTQGTGAYTVTDTLGDAVGYNVTAVGTALTRLKTGLMGINSDGNTHVQAGDVALNDNMTAYSYNCAGVGNVGIPAGTNEGGSRFKITFTTGGARGTAAFSILRPDGTTATNQVTAATNAIGAGLTLKFAAVDFTNGATIAIPVSCAAQAVQQTQTPDTLAASSGVLTGVSLGDGGTADSSKTFFSAEAGAGNGQYTFNIAHSASVRKNTLAGEHRGTFVVTAA